MRSRRLGYGLAVIVRRERPGDEQASRAVQVTAFGATATEAPGEPVEAELLDALRRCDGWIPELSWVAEHDGRIVGHCISTLGHVVPLADEGDSTGDPIAGVGLGPIGVLPDVQAAGVGRALMHASLGAADALGFPFVALLGDPAYYSRFGFVQSTEVGIEAPDPAWGVHFQVRTLATWSPPITGAFRYASPFDDLG